jgi:hypothetical protein
VKKQEWMRCGKEAGIESFAKEQRLQWCREYLDSDKHHEETPTTYYGEHDPFDVPISLCAICETSAQKVWRPKEGKPAWRVVCGCGASGDVTPYPRKAAFRWNKSSKSLSVCYTESPLFGLRGLTRADALQRLQLIYNDLTLKIEIATLRQGVGEHVAKGYIARLIAYVDWVQYLEDIIKDRSRNGVGRPEKEKSKTVA